MTDAEIQEQIDELAAVIEEMKLKPWPGADVKPPPVDPGANPWGA